MSKRHCDETVDHISKRLTEFEIQWASMRAEVEKKAREENAKTQAEKKAAAAEDKKNAAERRKEQKAKLTALKKSGKKNLLKYGVSSQLWNPTHERLANLDEL